MTDLLPALWSIGSAICILVWLAVAWHFRRLGGSSLLLIVCVGLTILTLVIFDVIVALAVLRILTGDAFRVAFTFAVGIQIVDALAALIFVRGAISGRWR